MFKKIEEKLSILSREIAQIKIHELKFWRDGNYNIWKKYTVCD